MADMGRRGGSRNWMRALFAGFWILLAGFSGLYLFTLLTDPSALGGQARQASAEPREEEIPAESAGTPAITPDQAAALLEADKTRDTELSEIKSSLRAMSDQVADLNTRLQPIEQFVGPVAALPRATSVTTSPPSPLPSEEPATQSATPAETPAPAPEQPPAQAATPEPEPVPPAPDRAPRPEPAAAAEPEQTPSTPPAVAAEPSSEPPADPAPPAEPVAAAEPAPAESEEPTPGPAATPAPATEDPAQAETAGPQPSESLANDSAAADATSPPDETPAAEPAPAATASEQPTSTPPPEGMETAALDPVTLPPAANDGTTRYGIEIGIVPKRDGLRPLWREYLTNHAALVAGLQPRRVLAPDKKWRLIAGPFANAQEAEAACSLFKKAERPCAATVYAGDSL